MQNEAPIDLSKCRLKIQRYCDKAERAPFDVEKKLIQYGVWQNDRQVLIAELISRNLLSESRFASAFAHDHFEFRKWSKRKIEMHLKAKRVSPRNIQDAIRNLPSEGDALQIRALLPALQKKYEKKGRLKNQYAAKALIRKGFQTDEVFKVLREMSESFDTFLD
jgi:regulatory protein